MKMDIKEFKSLKDLWAYAKDSNSVNYFNLNSVVNNYDLEHGLNGYNLDYLVTTECGLLKQSDLIGLLKDYSNYNIKDEGTKGEVYSIHANGARYLDAYYNYYTIRDNDNNIINGFGVLYWFD